MGLYLRNQGGLWVAFRFDADLMTEALQIRLGSGPSSAFCPEVPAFASGADAYTMGDMFLPRCLYSPDKALVCWSLTRVARALAGDQGVGGALRPALSPASACAAVPIFLGRIVRAFM